MFAQAWSARLPRRPFVRRSHGHDRRSSASTVIRVDRDSKSSVDPSDERLEIEHLFDIGKQYELDAPVLLPVGVGAVAGDGVGVAIARRV